MYTIFTEYQNICSPRGIRIWLGSWRREFDPQMRRAFQALEKPEWRSECSSLLTSARKKSQWARKQVRAGNRESWYKDLTMEVKKIWGGCLNLTVTSERRMFEDITDCSPGSQCPVFPLPPLFIFYVIITLAWAVGIISHVSSALLLWWQ